jgi:hypothetical protein
MILWDVARNADGTWRLTGSRGRFVRGFQHLTDEDLDALAEVLRRGRLLGAAPTPSDSPAKENEHA